MLYHVAIRLVFYDILFVNKDKWVTDGAACNAVRC